MGVKCDIALPCATQNELNEEEAKTLVANGCICVAEGANMPNYARRSYCVQKAKLLFAPGKAANAGGVATSGLEMSQNSLRLSWTSEEVDQKLKEIMLNIHSSCVKYGSDSNGYVDYVKEGKWWVGLPFAYTPSFSIIFFYLQPSISKKSSIPLPCNYLPLAAFKSNYQYY
jgi:glutamate dehydrogenase/leucine dehydrogenase